MEPLLSLARGLDPSFVKSQEIFLTTDLARIESILLDWIESLSRMQYDTHFDRAKLAPIKADCKTIIESDVVGLLKDKLKEKRYLTPSIERRIDWLSCTLFSLYSIPEPPQTIMVPYQANGSLNIRSFMPSPLARRHSLEQEAVTARLLRLSKDRTQDSKDQILSLFNDLDTLDKKVELLHKLPNEELYFVLEILFPHLSPDDFLFCLCNLELSQLKEAIYLTEHGLIGAVRQCLLSGSETAKKQFQEKAEALLFELSSYCNRHLKADLGNLADEFRSLKLHKISPSKLEEIKDLTQRIQHEQNIFIKLERLMRYFEWEPLVKSTFNDLTSSYSRSSMRLLPSGPYLPDSLFKILTEKAFGSAKDELEAADYIFEKWTFTSTEELAEIGLPPNWPKAKEALVKLGLKTILDLKMNHIYNKVLLKDFIERKKTETQTAALAAASGDIDD